MKVSLDTRKLSMLQEQLDPRAKAIVKKTAFEVSKRSALPAPVDTSALQ